MIWFTLALFVVSFIAVALLSPKPEIEDARAQDLDPNSFPRATEDSPVALVLGCVHQRAPNTLWYGGFRSKSIKEKVKTGIFSSKKVTVGYKYYLTFDLGVCLGPAGFCGDGIAVGGVGAGIDITDQLYGSYVVVSEGSFPLTLNSTTSPLVLDFTAIPDFDYETIGASFDITASYAVDVNRDGDPRAATRRLFVNPYADGVAVNWPGGISGNVVSTDAGDVTVSFDLTNTVTDGGALIDEVRINSSVFPFSNFGTSATVTSQPLYQIAGQIYAYGTKTFSISFEGGEGQEGSAFEADLIAYAGTFDQEVNACVEDLVGVGNVPAYRGTFHVVFCDAFLGESPQLEKITFTVASYATNISAANGGKLTADSVDINPAEAIYEILINDWRGLGIDEAYLDKSTFEACHATLLEENHGCSLIVSSPKTGKDVITEILRQVDGILRMEADGRIGMKLIRDDYDAGALPVYDEDDIIKIDNFTKTTWEDVRAQVKVLYSDRTKVEAEGRVAIAQDMAVYGMTGRLNSTDISFPFCYDDTLANQLAARELSRLSVPLFRMKVVMNRNAYALRPGDPIKISWAEYGLTEIIMRVQKIDLGELDNNRIIVELVQDVFAVNEVVYADPEDSLWDDDVLSPTDITTYEVTEVPYVLAKELDEPVADGFLQPVVLALAPTTDSSSYDVRSGPATGDANLLINDPDDITYPPSGTLTAAYSATAGFATGLDATGFTIQDTVGEVEDLENFSTTEVRGAAGLLWVDGEWMAYEGVTNPSTGTYSFTNVYRGILGTTPKDHASGTRVWHVNPALFGDGDVSAFIPIGNTLYFKMVDRVGGFPGTLEDLTERTFDDNDLANRPLRPRNLTLESSRDTDQVIGGTVTLAWVYSDRTVDQVTFENDATETPDLTETYEVETWIDGVQVGALDQTGIATNTTTVDLSAQVGAAGEFRVYSRRTTGAKRSAYYAFIPFILGNEELLSGDETGKVLLSGDEQAGGEGVTLSGS